MLKPLETEFKGRPLSLECTHRRNFPPPQMYGHTIEDIDVLWKQGNLDQNQHQLLKTWAENCGLMVMGPRCLDCPLALKRNPRPGRPEVIETENWLEAKRRMHWEDMKAAKRSEEGDDLEQQEVSVSAVVDDVDEPPQPEDLESVPWTDKEPVGFRDVDVPAPLGEAGDEEPEAAEEADKASEKSSALKEPVLSQDIIEALADD